MNLNLRRGFFLYLILFFALSIAARGDERSCQSTINSIGVFKNGIFVVHETVTLPGGGTWILANPPKPIHGTFFLESPVPVSVQSAIREVDVPLNQVETMDWSRDFAGHKVAISFGGERVVGEFLGTGEGTEGGNSLDTPATAYGPYSNRLSPGEVSNSTSAPLVFRKESGELLFLSRKADISSVEVLDSQKMQSVKRPNPVLIFTVPEDDSTTAPMPVTVRMTWLAKGISWAPSYRINIVNREKILLEQTAVLINEARDLTDVDFYLISGFPQIPFGNVTSPVDPKTSLANFFQSLTAGQNQLQGGAVTMQQAVVFNQAYPNQGQTESAIDEVTASLSADTLDTFYQPIGRHTLAQGDRLVLSIAKKETPWKKVVRWNIPDLRDERGRSLSYDDYLQRRMNRYGAAHEDTLFSECRDPQDTIQFCNPFDFPITTGVISFFETEKFRGQGTLFWVNPDSETSAIVNKALSISVANREEEISPAAPMQNIANNARPILAPSDVPVNQADEKGNTSDTQTVRIYGDYYRIATIKAEMTVENHREEEATVVVTRRFSGEPVPAESVNSSPDTNPAAKTTIVTDQVNGVNRRHEISWTLTLTPGETRTVEFYYQVLIQI
ncbi:MAG: hypothetical protein Q4G68_01290 [Planctomycetia bacterium]|nr:hypothetical protein [Planctomycetia bacterium]